jgi:hypothetical protein
MVDPTWTRTCPCGEKIRVNQLGQHHHTDCEFDPIHPSCCSDPSIKRLWYFNGSAGTRCESCGETWGEDLSEKVSAMASSLINDYDIERSARAVIYQQNRRAIKRGIGTLR